MRFLHPRTTRSVNGRRTRYLGIASSLRESIRDGQLAAGEYLPSSRELSRQYQVHRHTVLVALDTLLSEGWVVAEPRRGYRVCPQVPEAQAKRDRGSAVFRGFRIVRAGSSLPASVDEVPYPLHAALADPALIPRRELRAAYAHVLERPRSRIFDQLDDRGLRELRNAVSVYLRRVRAVVPEDLLLTHGSQEAISLVAQALLAPGDGVAMEEPGYPPARDAFRAAGAEVLPIPVDAQGLSIEHLRAALDKQKSKVRLVYVTPTHQYPTTVSLSGTRRDELLGLTLERGIPILEDDYDHEYHYRGSPPAPLAASGAPHVLYVSTFSKLIGPTFRVGWIAARPELIDALVQLRRTSTRANDAVTAAALADWMQDGGFERHVRRARRCYAERCAAAVDSLELLRQDGLIEFQAPSGGMSIWARFPGIDSERLAARARERGVLVAPEYLLGVRGRGNGVRLAFARLAPARFREAVAILAEVARC
jgi:GntR family transcriptional regulator/MocR family aminotransferase